MLIAVLRRPQGLFGLWVARNSPFTVPPRDAPCLAESYSESVQPLGASQATRGQPLWDASLESLESVRKPSPETLAGVLGVLARSVPDPGAYPTNLPDLELQEAIKPRRTAAHPRGFKGTKFKPPKPAAPTVHNVLPYLDGGKYEAALLQMLRPHLQDALEICSRTTEFGALLQEAGEDVLQPYGQAWFGASLSQIPSLPPEFRRYLLWATRGMSRSSVGRLISSYWALDLANQPLLRLIVAQMLARSPTPTTISWIAALESASTPRRACLAELMLETSVFHAHHSSPKTLIAQLEELCRGENYRHRAYHLLDRVGHDKSAEYLFDGFALANRYDPTYRFHEHGDGNNVRLAVETVMTRLQTHDETQSYNHFALRLWRHCGILEGLSETLRDLPLAELDPETTYLVADLLSEIAFHYNKPEEMKAKWERVRAHAHAFAEALQAIPAEYREKATRCISDLLWAFTDPVRLEGLLDDYIQLMPRLCAPPFPKDGYIRDPLSSLARLPNELWQAVCQAPDRSFKALEKASRRENETRLIGLGLWTLAKHLPQLTAATFRDCPAALCRQAKLLGCLPEPARVELLGQLQASSAFQCDPTTLPAPELVALVDHGAKKPCSYVSRRLRAHIEVAAPMTDSQVERAKRRITSHWNAILLSRLEQAVLGYMAANLHPDIDLDHPSVRHALMLQYAAAGNRRALRKMLEARLSGNFDYLLSHPESRAWLQAHPSIDAQLWINGLVHHRATPKHDVTLSIEHDPLEALRIGTYAGTCLALGGGLEYSAAAVALDINKQVVYCRDARGIVLARQLIALSEKERLHCFEVYPESTEDEIKSLFWEYDRELANALGVPLLDPDVDDDNEDEIAFLLAQTWWYDYPVSVLSG